MLQKKKLHNVIAYLLRQMRRTLKRYEGNYRLTSRHMICLLFTISISNFWGLQGLAKVVVQVELTLDLSKEL